MAATRPPTARSCLWLNLGLNLAAGLAMGTAGCGSSSHPPARVCVAGQSSACACTNGDTGAQTCVSNGAGFGACVCAPGNTGTGGAIGSGGTAGDTGTGGSGSGGIDGNGPGGGPASGGANGTGGVGTGGRGGGGSGTGGGTSTGGAGGRGGIGTGGIGTGGSASGGRGGTGTGGTGTGGSGTGGGGGSVGCAPATIFDDMEDGNANVCANAGRSGAWKMFLGQTGQVDPPAGAITGTTLIPGGRGASTRAMHFSGSGFTPPSYATIGAPLANSAYYDLTGFTAVRFWARSELGPVTLRVDVPSRTTEGTADGGTCVVVTNTDCYDYYGANVSVTSTWAQFYVTLSQLAQLGWGKPVPPDLANSMWVQFHYAPQIGNFTNPGVFNIWIDDIEFVP